MTERHQIKTNMLIALFAALIASGAFIRVPVGPVPITLTTFFLLTSGLLLPVSGAVLSAAVYLIIGVAGLPVFAGGSGPAVFAGPTGGYLVSYIPAVLVCAAVSKTSKNSGKNRSLWRDIVSVVMASLIIYAVGVPWLKWRLDFTWVKALSAGMLPFLFGDALKAAAAVSLAAALNKTAPELLPRRA